MVRSGFDERFPPRRSANADALAHNVRRLRIKKGWTQNDLAAEADVDQHLVSRVENSRANPTLETLEALAATLEVRLIELFESRTSK
jgi:transcriptional regulator with XRE-family HTH domain